MKQKITIKGKVNTKPRNRDVPAMRMRVSGAHGKTKKALRKEGRMELTKKLRSGRAFDDDFASPGLFRAC